MLFFEIKNVFGANAQITANAANDAFGIDQESTERVASTTFGSGAHISVTGGNDAIGINQRSTDNRFALGENSVVRVVAGNNGTGLRQRPRAIPNVNKAVIQANSRINVVAGGIAVGISSSTTTTNPSFLTLEHGVNVSASGNTAFGVSATASNLKLLNSGRVSATSTNAAPMSYGFV